jgi:hypothetical protein
LGPMCAGFRRTPRRISDTEDCLAERLEFELAGDFASGQ